MRLAPLVVILAASGAFAVKTVHVVQTCHLDVGFADTAANIVERYHSYLLQAANTSKWLREHPQPLGEGLKFTTHSYLVSLLFDCPPGLGFTCFNASEKKIVSDAFAQGDLVLQAFPFNAETATLSSSLFESALQLTKKWAGQLGVAAPITMTQRDGTKDFFVAHWSF